MNAVSRFGRHIQPMKTLLLMGALAFSTLPLHAADEEKKEASAPSATLDEVSLGEALVNGPISKDDLKGKAVVIKLWGVH
jgi:hypothetical protein